MLSMLVLSYIYGHKYCFPALINFQIPIPMYFSYYINILNEILNPEKEQKSFYHKTRISTTELDKLITKSYILIPAKEGEHNPTAKPHLHNLSCICSHDGDKTNSPQG